MTQKVSGYQEQYFQECRLGCPPLRAAENPAKDQSRNLVLALGAPILPQPFPPERQSGMLASRLVEVMLTAAAS